MTKNKLDAVVQAVPLKPFYRDERTVIYNADCREVLPYLPRFDLLLTDIPYGEVNRESGGLRNLDKRDADNETISPTDVVDMIGPITGGSAYVWCGTEQLSALRSQMIRHGLTTRVCVWEKTNPSPMNGEHFWLSSLELCVFGRRSNAAFNQHCESPVFRYPSGASKIHPTQKPTVLFKKLISASTGEQDSILDPFMGSGTSLVAAKLEGRYAVGIEISEDYCRKAAERLRQGVLF